MTNTNRFVFPSHLRGKNINTSFAPNTNGRTNLRAVTSLEIKDLQIGDPAVPIYRHAEINQESRAAVSRNEFGDHEKEGTAVLLYYGAHPSSSSNYMP